MRSVSRLVALVLGVALTPVFVAHAAPDDVKLDFAAATPSTYSHAVGGGQWADGSTAYTVESLEGGDFACGDLVTFFTKVDVDTGATGQTIDLDYTFLADSTGQPGVALGDILDVQVNTGDPANIGDNGSTATLVAGPTLVGTKYTQGAHLDGTVHVTDLEAGETVIVRVDSRIDCLIDATPTGNLQASITAAHVVPTGTIPVGNQTVPFKSANDLRSGAIQAVKYNDLNGNGQFDTGEPKLSGWTLFVDADHSGANNSGDTSAVTDNNGSATFTHVTPATYQVCELLDNGSGQPHEGWSNTDPGTSPPCDVAVVVVAGETTMVDLGNQFRKAATETVTKVHDAGHTVVTSVPLGASVHDSATVTSAQFGTPTGTVSFRWFTNDSCDGDGVAAGTVALVSGVAHPSDVLGPLAAGSYSFEATYNGDETHAVSTGACEPLTVTSSDLSITKTDGGAVPVAGGGTFTYTLAVDNLGPSDAQSDATVVDVLPAEISFVSFGVLSVGVACDPPVGQTISCTIAKDLLEVSDEAVQIPIEVSVSAGTTVASITNKSIVSSPDDEAPCTATPADISCNPSDTNNYAQVVTPLGAVAGITTGSATDSTTGTAAPSAGPLAFTGSHPARLALLGAMIVGVGASVLLVRRRGRGKLAGPSI